MNPKHLLDFIEDRLKYFQVKHDESYNLYLEFEAKENAKWWRKFFNCKYQPDWWDRWDFQDYRSSIYRLNKIKPKVEYYVKMQYNTYTQEDDHYGYDLKGSFYKWCKDNKIPY